MARETLLDAIPVPPDHIHRIRGELPPAEAAAAYEAELEAALAPDGRLDLILLGMGADGHTASLFPGTPALEERERAVVAVHLDRPDTWRVTLTLPTINAARHALFLVAGAEKGPALARVLAGEPLPAGRVQPPCGRPVWLVDRAAFNR
jgi:6-phosphogluconolactonase